MNVLDLAQKKVQLKKVASTHGGEWHGPCPDCGGKDRFHVWPAEMDGKGAYWCRGCGKTGDNIQFLHDFDGLSFPEACSALGIALPDRPSPSLSARFKSPVPPSAQNLVPSPFTPAVHESPADLWREHAEKFVLWAREKLRSNAEALSWLDERGIDARTAGEFRLGWNPGENGKDIYRVRKAWGLPETFREDDKPKALWIPRGLVIPYYDADGVLQRIRIRRPDGEPRYYVLPGSSMSVMMIGKERKAYVVVESELDAIACAAACPLAGAVALGSVAAKPDIQAEESLRAALSILLAVDYDDAGKKAVAWWLEHYSNCRRWPVPIGKDPGDARKMGMDLEQWIKAGLPPALTIETGSAVSIRKESDRIEENGKESNRNVENVKESESTQGAVSSKASETTASYVYRPNLPPSVLELYELLQKNPGVQIINSESRFTVLRNGKYVGGRINELVFRVPEVTDYIFAHPEDVIDATNFIMEN